VYKIKDITKNEINQCSRLHRQELPEDLFALLGEKFLGRYYESLLKDSSLKFCLFIEKNKVKGACFFVKRFRVFPFLAQNFLIFNVSSIKLLCFRPKKIFSMIDIALLLLSFPKRLPDYELAYIYVSDDAKGKGIGQQLISHIDLQEESWVKTLETTPRNIEFYKRNRYFIVDKKRGRVFLKRNKDG